MELLLITYNDLPAYLLDASGLRCPLPVLHTKKHLETFEPNTYLVVKVSDLSFKIDFLVLCDKINAELVDSIEQEKPYTYVIRKKT
jgi:tRNA 2-thiouridine synthesizing protein A